MKTCPVVGRPSDRVIAPSRLVSYEASGLSHRGGKSRPHYIDSGAEMVPGDKEVTYPLGIS
jgi:hypothetical protein